MGWWKAACSVRITNANFDFEHQTWSVEGYLDMIGPDGCELIVSKMFKHTWEALGDDYRLLRKIVEDKVGVDLWEQERMWNALSDNEKAVKTAEMKRLKERREYQEAQK